MTGRREPAHRPRRVARVWVCVGLALGLGCTGIGGWQADRRETARAAAEVEATRSALAEGEVVATAAERKPLPPLAPPGVAVPRDRGGMWSEPVNGLKARLIIARGEGLRGTPVLDTYVEIQYVSSYSARPIVLRWQSADLKWAVTDSAGAAVAESGSTGGSEAVRVFGPSPLVIPSDATLRLCVTRTWSGVRPNRAAHLDVGSCWEFERGDWGRYFLAGKVTVPANGVVDSAGRPAEWSGTLVLPKAEIPLASHP